MLRLRPFKNCDAAAVASWVGDEIAFYKWSAGILGEYPMTPDRLLEHYHQQEDNEDHWAMTAFDENGAAGHLIMRFVDDEKKVLRFGFIIINPTLRGRGYGRQLLTLAAQYAFTCIRPERITLGVFENNPAALKCYQSIGMTKTGEQEISLMGEKWRCFEMELLPENLRVL